MRRNRGLEVGAPLVAQLLAQDAWAAGQLIAGLKRRELIALVAILSAWTAELLEREHGDDALAVVQDMILWRESRQQ